MFIASIVCIYIGTNPRKKQLKPGSVPTVFAWNKPNPLSEKRTKRVLLRSARQTLDEKQNCVAFHPAVRDEEITCAGEEVIDSSYAHLDEIAAECSSIVKVDEGTQTDKLEESSFSVLQFIDDAAGLHYYTGLENYVKFCFVLSTLGPAAYCLNYRWHSETTLSIPNQFFLTLIKLRLNRGNFEISRIFRISEFAVSNIFLTWINFMYRQWRELNIWPTRDLVKYFMPTDFAKKFPATRCIVDGMECPIVKPKNPRAQQATFSTYKNRNTLKVLVSASPGGIISNVTHAYGGSATDRQLIERGSLLTSCECGDSIMADKGFNVQDIFATRDIKVNIPAFFKRKNRLSANVLRNDRLISSKRVHIERVIGLIKTYKILCQPLDCTKTTLGTEIIFCCSMLCNFRNCIVPRTA